MGEFGTGKEKKSVSEFWNIVKIAGIGAIILVVIFTAFSLYGGSKATSQDDKKDINDNPTTEAAAVAGLTGIKTQEIILTFSDSTQMQKEMSAFKPKILYIGFNDGTRYGWILLQKADTKNIEFLFEGEKITIINSQIKGPANKNFEVSSSMFKSLPMSTASYTENINEGNFILYAIYYNI